MEEYFEFEKIRYSVKYSEITLVKGTYGDYKWFIHIYMENMLFEIFPISFNDIRNHLELANKDFLHEVVVYSRLYIQKDGYIVDSLTFSFGNYFVETNHLELYAYGNILEMDDEPDSKIPFNFYIRLSVKKDF
jgi:hypothetical protein